jgi:cbb3-type cytochrome oxidase cytochrome c subunit
MPCSDGGPSYSDCSEERAKIDKLTQDLCYLCATLMESKVLKKYANARIIAWHKEHMAKDQQRVREEMVPIFKTHPKMSTHAVALEFYNKAVQVHPVSNYHKEWFLAMANQISKEVNTAIKQRKEKDKKKQDAIGKLSKEERALLNL